MAASDRHEHCFSKFTPWKNDYRRDTADDVAGKFFEIFCNRNIVHPMPRAVSSIGRLHHVVKRDDNIFEIYVGDDGKLAGLISPDVFFIMFCCEECRVAMDETERRLLEDAKGIGCRRCGLQIKTPSTVKCISKKEYAITEVLHVPVPQEIPRITATGYLMSSMFYPNFHAETNGILTLNSSEEMSFVCQKCLFDQASADVGPLVARTTSRTRRTRGKLAEN